MRESISFLLKFVDLFEKIGNVLILSGARLFPLGDLILLLGKLILVLEVLFFSLFNVLGHHISVSNKIKNVSLFIISLFSEVLNLSGKGINTRFSDLLLMLSFL